MAHLIIIRGLPGSGKSTLAKLFGYNHFEADQFFVDAEGVYNFDRNNIREAHRWCKGRVFDSLTQGQDTVVSNTFSTVWEMEPYLNFCEGNKHKVTVIKAENCFESIHNVPHDVIANMARRWEDYG